ncbi:MAG: flagellar motor protein MotB [Humidesulfovibrio sp.]|nr:flagellar motor protein MotB [Humidesulfovibrio sp.]
MSRRKGHSGGSWKVAYADFVTAMMAFFLLMWIMNMVPPETRQVLSTFFQPVADEKGMGGPQVLDAASNTMVPLARGIPNPDPAAEESQRFVIASRLRRIVMENPKLMDASGLSSDETGVLLRVNNNIMFRPGSAQLTPEAKHVMDGVLDVLKQYNMNLLIRGHAAEQEPVGGTLETPWELSGARSAAAASYILSTNEILPTRVRAISYGSTRPLRPDTSTENRLSNGRVEFYFHRPDALNFGSGL